MKDGDAIDFLSVLFLNELNLFRNDKKPVGKIDRIEIGNFNGTVKRIIV